MGLFVKKYYSSKVVALNDIGAVSYLADAKILDLWGLGSKEAACLRLKNSLDTDALSGLAAKDHAEIAIIYDDWFSNAGISFIPREWIKVGEWAIRDSVIWGDTVSFYAIDNLYVETLARNLHDFAPQLPKGVQQHLLVSREASSPTATARE
jgi:hypothetical protein